MLELLRSAIRRAIAIAETGTDTQLIGQLKRRLASYESQR
jgi:hypothetical protein